jgi:hypothetical protein
MRRPLLGRIALLAVLAAPLAGWAFVKPVRVLAPQLAGVSCYSGGVCTDDAGKLDELVQMKAGAVNFVELKLGAMADEPRIIFCSTEACERSFGIVARASYNVGTVGVVVARRGWQPYFIRHELIHHLQGERIGTLRMWLKTPTWIIEGMAYSVSEDPRHPLQQPWEAYRQQYERWAATVPHSQLWSAARAQ